MTNGFGIVIDGVVAILLCLTIGYCTMLNRRLKLLKADEHSLRATISELITATEIAERAIAGLKLTVHECDMGLGERLRKAERVTIEIDRTIVAGKDLIGRLSQIVTAGRGHERLTLAPVVPAAAQAAPSTTGAAAGTLDVPVIEDRAAANTNADAGLETNKPAAKKTDARAVAAAVGAFAERLRSKAHGLAA